MQSEPKLDTVCCASSISMDSSRGSEQLFTGIAENMQLLQIG